MSIFLDTYSICAIMVVKVRKQRETGNDSDTNIQSQKAHAGNSEAVDPRRHHRSAVVAEDAGSGYPQPHAEGRLREFQGLVIRPALLGGTTMNIESIVEGRSVEFEKVRRNGQEQWQAWVGRECLLGYGETQEAAARDAMRFWRDENGEIV